MIHSLQVQKLHPLEFRTSSLGLTKNLTIHNMMLKVHFSLGDYIYITPNQKNLICKLYKTIYGPRQSSCEWYKRINDYLDHVGLK
jgi:hypothetical protein